MVLTQNNIYCLLILGNPKVVTLKFTLGRHLPFHLIVQCFYFIVYITLFNVNRLSYTYSVSYLYM